MNKFSDVAEIFQNCRIQFRKWCRRIPFLQLKNLLFSTDSTAVTMAQSINIELKHPFSMLISGVKGISKAAFTKNLLKYRDEMISPPPRRVIYSLYTHYIILSCQRGCYPYVKLQSMFKVYPPFLTLWFYRNQPNLIILDDIIVGASFKKSTS